MARCAGKRYLGDKPELRWYSTSVHMDLVGSAHRMVFVGSDLVWMTD